jgi:uncharacterized protein (DUF1778 family)
MTDNLKTEKIEIRISPEEKRIIEAEADRRGLSNSELLRATALKAAKKTG